MLMSPKPALWLGASRSNPIDDGQLNIGRCAAQADGHRSAGMPERVAQRFLQHAEQAKRRILGEILRNALSTEVDVHVMPCGKFAAEAGGCRCQAQKLQLCRVQPLRDDLNPPRQFSRLIADLLDASVFAG